MLERLTDAAEEDQRETEADTGGEAVDAAEQEAAAHSRVAGCWTFSSVTASIAQLVVRSGR